MNDTNTRLQESLLPIGQNSQQPGAFRPGQTTVTNSAGYSQVPTTRFNPTTTTYVTSTTASSTHEDDSWSRAKKYCWWTAVILTVVLVFLLVALKLFLFKPINKHPPKLDNSTAIEPNTKTRFNLMVEGPRNRVQSLTGASVWVYTIPIPTHPKISLAAVGFYVDRAEGKKRLKRFRGEEIDDERFEDVKDVLVQSGMTETLRVVLATTPPTGRMLELWGLDTKPIMEKICPDLLEKEWNGFAEFFPDPFNKGDEFTFERREGNELYAWRKGEDRTKAKRIGGVCMARALFEFHLSEQKQGLINLLDDFFER